MVFAGEPTEVDFALVAYEITQWIHLVALLEEYAAVAALASAHKEYNIVILSKFTNLRNTVCHSAAYCVVALEFHLTAIDATLYFANHLLKSVERFGGLRVEIDIAVEVDFVHLIGAFYHQRMAFGLPHETVDLSMAFFAVDHHLWFFFMGFAMIGVADAALQLQHHRAGGIYYLYSVGSSHFVGFGRLTVGA